LAAASRLGQFANGGEPHLRRLSEGFSKDRRLFALSMGQILAHEAAGSMRRNMPKQIPAVLLGRLAIDRAWQGKGLGRALLADAVRRSLLASSEVSARLVIVHAISPAAEAFYLHHGYAPAGRDPTFALDLVKFKSSPNRCSPPPLLGPAPIK